MDARRLKWRMAAVYGALFMGIGVSLPYLPVWLKAKGLSPQDIGLALALQSVMRVLVAPAVSHLADRLGRLRPVMAFSSLGVLIGLLHLALFAVGRGEVLLGVAIAFGALAPMMPLSDAYAITMVRRHGLDYGRMRLWGSLSFIIAAVGAGALQDVLPARMLIWLIVLAQSLLFFAVLALPPRERETGAEESNKTTSLKRTTHEPAIAILSWPFILFVIVAGLVQSSHAFVYGFSAIHWKNLGYSGTTVGLLWMTGVIAEIVLFWFSEKVMAHLGAVRLMLLGATAGLLRWLGLSLDPPLAALFLLQALHGMSFGATHLGAIEFVRTRLPARRTATAQAAYGAVSHGVFMTAAMWLSGWLYANFGARGWWAMAGMCLMAALLGLWLRHVARLPRPITLQTAA